MRRKLIKQGDNALTVTLPIKWLRKNNYNAGDEIELTESENVLVIGGQRKEKLERIDLDISSYDHTTLLKKMHQLYKGGYNEIHLVSSNLQIMNLKTKKMEDLSKVVKMVAERLIGVEIVSQTESKFTLKFLFKETTEDFRAVLRRIFYMIKELCELINNALLSKDYSSLNQAQEMHDNITKFISYSTRVLNRDTGIKYNDAVLFYHIIRSLDKITDFLRYCCSDILSAKKLSKETKEIIRMINQQIIDYSSNFYNFNNKTIQQIIKNRFQIREKIASLPSMKKHEMILIVRFSAVVEIILDLVEARMGLEES